MVARKQAVAFHVNTTPPDEAADSFLSIILKVTLYNLPLGSKAELCIMHRTPSVIIHTLSLFAIASWVGATQLRNITIAVPDRTRYYQNPDVLCLPASWTDLVSFYVANYFTHAATVRNGPGTDSVSKILNLGTAFLFPAWGLSQAISDILSFSSFFKCDLDAAARAGAFCMVVRSSGWQASPGDSTNHALLGIKSGLETRTPGNHRALCLARFDAGWANFEFGATVTVKSQKVHGSQHLPPGYELVVVPRHARVERRNAAHEYTEIKSKYSAAKTLIAIVQLLYALTTLYESRAHQIDQFGFAAFGLTVAPYAIMSLVNLIAGLFCPDFEELYLLNSSTLEEARARPDSHFEEVAGDLVEYEDRAVEPPDTYLGANFFNVQVTFGPDEKGERLLASLVGPPQNTGTQAVRDEKSQNTQSSILPVNEVATSHQVVETQDPRPIDGPYLVFDDQKSLRDSGYNTSTILMLPSCSPFKKTTHPASRLFFISGKQKEDSQRTDLKFDMDKEGVLFNFSATDICAFISASVVYCAIIGIVGGISRFRPGDSTFAQRVWTMTWLAVGLAYFAFVHTVGHAFARFKSLNRLGFSQVFYAFVSYVPAAPAVGGLVVVGQMLWAYGTCTELS